MKRELMEKKIKELNEKVYNEIVREQELYLKKIELAHFNNYRKTIDIYRENRKDEDKATKLINESIRESYRKIEKDLNKMMKKTITTAFLLSYGINYILENERDSISREKINKIINIGIEKKNFGRTYKERLYKLENDLKWDINSIILDGVENGYAPDIIAKKLFDTFKTTRKRALTVARTEMARAYSQTKLDQLKEDEYSKGRQIIILATLDNKTSSICRQKDGTILDVDNTTYEDLPPYHPNCRTDWAVYTGELPEKRLENIGKSQVKWMNYNEFNDKFLKRWL